MANSIAKLAILLTTDASGVSKGFAQAKVQVQDFSGQIASIAGQLAALAGGTAAISWGVKLAAEAETAKVGFEVMLGSAEKAAKMLGDIKAFAAATPFGGADLRDAAKTMLAFGVSAEDIMPSLKMLGDVAGGNSQKLGSLALVFGQIASAGKLTGGDLLQLINVGFNPLQVMAAGSTEKYKELRKEMESGNITFQMVKDAFIQATSAGGQFNGMMERMSKTVEGRWSTLKDQFAELALAIGEKLLPVASRMIDLTSQFLTVLQRMDAMTVENTVKLVAFAAAFGTALVIIPKVVGAIKTLIAMYRSLTIAQSIQQAMSGPKGWATLAASLLVAAGAATAVSAMFDESNKALAQSSKEAAKATEATKKLNTEIAAGTDGDAAKKAAESLKQLQTQGESLAKSLRTPFEKVSDELLRARDLWDAGVISADTYARAMAKAREDLAAQSQSADEIRNRLRQQNGPVAALQFGTQQAVSAINAAAREQKIEAEVQKQVLAESRKTNDLLAKILRERGEKLNVNEVNL
jgi:tape measure domain-containing protein